MTHDDLVWLAGLLEGEGSFLPGPPSARNAIRIQITMIDKDVIARVAALWGLSYCSVRKDRRNKRWKRQHQVILRGSRASVLMQQLRPLMGERRRRQIDRAIASYTFRLPGGPRKLREEDVAVLRRRMQYEPLLRLSKEFGVSRTTLRQIRRREIWKSVA